MINFGNLNLVTDEQRKLLDAVNETKATYPADLTLMHLFHEQVAQHGERVAISFQGAELTYEQLHRQANRTAQLLRRIGVGRGDLVAVLMDRSLEAYLSIFGALKAGAAYLPMDANLPKDRVQFVVKNSGAKAVLTKSTYMTPVEGTGAFVILQDELLGFQKAKKRTGKVFDRVDLEQSPDETLPLETEPSDLAYVIYTSGSTGLPKGVMIEHRSAVNFVDWVKKEFAMSEQSRVMQNASLFFDASVQMMFSALTCGATLCPVPDKIRIDPPAFVEWMKDERITHWDSVPSLWYQIVNHLQFHVGTEPHRFPHLQAILLAGEALYTDKVKLWRRIVEPTHDVYNIYGPTEATVDATFYKVRGDETKSMLPIGKPLQNMEAYILTPEGQSCLPNVVGELYLGGVGVARGYFNNEELTAASFVDNPLPGKTGRLYRTGDYAKLLPDGNIEYTGRRDEQVKINGQRIEISEIEQMMRSCEGVQEAAVLYKKDEEGSQGVLLGYYSLKSDAELTADQLRDLLADKLTSIMIPSQLVEMKAFPMTANKKIDKKELATLAISNDGTQATYVPPRTETEKLLAAIWMDVLKKERVSLDDDFFSLGGDSILSILVRHKCEQNGLTLKNVDLFKYPKLSELAAYIEENREQLTMERQQAVDLSRKLTPKQRARLPETAHKALPVLPMQQAMMFVDDTSEADDTLYVVQSRFRFEGEIEEAAFEKALNVVISRHEALRTIFRSDLEEQPLQVILSEATMHVESRDLSDAAEEEREALIRRLMTERAVRGFDLGEWPLFHVALLKQPDGRFDVVWTIHHIIADGWSTSVMIREFLHAYVGFAKKKFKPLPTLKAQYTDYVNARLAMDDEQAKAYWKAQLADAEPTELPRDRVASAEGERFGKLQATLSAEQTAALKKVSEESGLTLNTLCLAAYALLLQQVTRQDDLLFGIVTSGRSVPVTGIEELLGCLINTLPLRVRLADTNSFADVVRQVASELNAMREQEHLDFTDVRKQAPHLAGRELIESIFLFQNYPGNNEFTGELDERLQLVEVEEHENTHFPLTTVCYEDPTTRDLQFTMKYSQQLFRDETVAQWMNLLLAVLRQVAQRLTAPLADWDWLSEADAAVWQACNQTEKPVAATSVVERFEAAVERNADHTAVRIGEAHLTYGELQKQANQTANFLRDQGVQEGNAVLLVASRSLPLYSSLLGTLKAGAAYVPAEPDFPIERVLTILADVQARVVLADHAWLQQHAERLPNGVTAVAIDAPEVADGGRFLGANSLREQPETAAALAPCADRPMYYIFTSGSTGKPKGVRIGQPSLLNFIDWFVTSFDVGPRSRVGQNASICFDASVQAVFSSLTTGATLYPVPEEARRDPSVWLAWLGEQEITHFDAVPSHWGQLLEAAQSSSNLVALPQLRWIVLGGEALDYRRTERWRQTVQSPVRIAHVYGPTEATVNATWLTVEHDRTTGKVPIGLPLPNYRLHVLDKQGRVCPPHVYGELYIGGVGLADGYTDPEATRRSFVEHEGERLYKTGDLVRLVALADGTRFFEFGNRVDEQVKVNGYRIELPEIEAVAETAPQIERAAVIIREVGTGKQIVCCYMAADDRRVELLDHLQRHLPSYMVPARVQRVEQLPVTTSGKIDRRRLAELVASVRESDDRSGGAPRTELEADLLRIWQEDLGLEATGIRDHFFAVGGSSLVAMNFLRKARGLTDLPLFLADIYRYPTIAELSESLQAKAERLTTQGGDQAAEPQPITFGERMLDEAIWSAWKAQILQAQPTQTVLGEWETTPAVRLQLANGDRVNAQTYLHLAIDTSVDLPKFNEALRAIVRAHPMLRAHIRRDADGTPAFVEREPVDLSVPVLDLRPYDAPSREQVFRELDTFFRSGFQVTEGPLYRLALVQEGEHRYQFYWWFSHLIADGESMRLILQELQERYLFGRTPTEQAEQPSYADYVAMLKAMRADDIQPHLEKWERFAKAAERLHDYVQEHRAEAAGYFTKTLTLDGAALADAADPVSALYVAAARAITAWSGEAEVPFLEVYHGRYYRGQAYYGIVGDLTDRVPILIDSREPQQTVERAVDLHVASLMEQLLAAPETEQLARHLQQNACPVYFNFTEGRSEQVPAETGFRVLTHQERYQADLDGTLHLQAERDGEQIHLTLIGYGLQESAMENLWQAWAQACQAVTRGGAMA
ncbi:MAG TPA: amino acid adenylation domain-containing protein [Bacilli bacterium]|nr:amino acid adenylation domain-containing protein [Bacilli bacterium]